MWISSNCAAACSAICRWAIAVGVLLLAELVFVIAGWHVHPGAAQLRFAPAPAGVSNTVALGQIIYTKYILLFQAAGLVLLVAMIGAIVLTLARPAQLAPSAHRGAERADARRYDGTAGRGARAPVSVPAISAARRSPSRTGSTTTRTDMAAVTTRRKRTTRRRVADMIGSMPVGVGHFLVVSAILLMLGVFGIFLNRKNVIVILMSVELILLAVNLNLVAFSAALGRSGRSGDGDVRADRRGGGGGDRACHRRRVFPQSRLDPG